jgi:hypothetical protein
MELHVGTAMNIASTAESLLESATVAARDATEATFADMVRDMRIMQHRIAKALAELGEESA